MQDNLTEFRVNIFVIEIEEINGSVILLVSEERFEILVKRIKGDQVVGDLNIDYPLLRLKMTSLMQGQIECGQADQLNIGFSCHFRRVGCR